MTEEPRTLRPLDPPFSLKGKRVWVAGHRGMVGSAIVRRLASEDCEILTVNREDLDLRRQADVEAWMAKNKPEVVFLAAATVGGILANEIRPAEFLYDNLALEGNIINAAKDVGVEKLLFLGSSCIYPKLSQQPMPEDALLTGPLEPTNEWYAVAKIAGIKLCQSYRRQYGMDFVSAMPTNLYGPGDNFDLQSSHVLPALIAKIHRAKSKGETSVGVWGTGKPKREFLYVDDCADAALHVTKYYSGDTHINVGFGTDISIAKLAAEIAETIGYHGAFAFDIAKPDGTPRKLLDSTRLRSLGWSPQWNLKKGIRNTYDWYVSQFGAVEASFR